MTLQMFAEWWNSYIADPAVMTISSAALSGLSFVLLALSIWELFSPPRKHRPQVEQRWEWLRISQVLALALVSFVFALAGFLESERIGLSVRALCKNLSLSLLIFVYILHAIMRRGDTMKREALKRQGIGGTHADD